MPIGLIIRAFLHVASIEGMARKPKDLTPRFGIGEWYGYNLTQLSGAERQALATNTLKPDRKSVV